MIKTYCDICGEEITSLDTRCRYKIKKFEIGLPHSAWECLTVHKVCWRNLAKIVAERRGKHILGDEKA